MNNRNRGQKPLVIGLLVLVILILSNPITPVDANQNPYYATGQPSYTYGSSTGGSYPDTFTSNDQYHQSSSSSYEVGDTFYATKYATGDPAYTWGSSTGGSYSDTLTDNSVYHVSTAAQYISSTPNILKYTTGAPTYVYGSSTGGSYSDTLSSNDVYHVSTAASYPGSSGTAYKLATGAPTYTWGSSTSGTYSDTLSINSQYHVSTSSSYITGGSPTIDFRYNENLATNTTTSTTYQTDCLLNFQPTAGAYYLVLGFAQLKGSSTSYNTNAQLVVNTTVYQQVVYRVRSASCWYDVAFMKRIYIGPATTTAIRIKFASSSTSGTASIQMARLLAMNPATEYAEAETRTTTTSTSWQNKTVLSLTPIVGKSYLIFLSANIDGASTSYNALYRVITNNGTVLMSGQKRTGVAAARYSVGLMRVLSFSTTSDKIVLQYCTSSASGAAGISYTHIAAIRQDVFKNSWYKDAQGTEYTPAVASTWYDTAASVTYTPEATQHIIFACMEEKAGSTTGYVQWRQNNNAALNNTDQLYEPNANDYECEWNFVRLNLAASSRTDKLQYLGSTTSARVRNPRIISFQMANAPLTYNYRVDYFYGFQFTEAAKAAVTQLGWTVRGHSHSVSGTNIFIYDFAASQWDDTSLDLASSDSNSTQASVTINDYMDASGNMRIRFYLQNIESSSFNVEIDYMEWKVTYSITQYRVDYWYAFQFTEAARSAVTQLGWSVEGKTSSPTVKIYIYNWVSVGWDDTSQTLTSTEGTKGSASVTINDYMDASGNMRIRFQKDGEASSFTVSIDYMYWSIDYNIYKFRIDYFYRSQFTEAPRADVQELNWTSNGLDSLGSCGIFLWDWVASEWDDTTQTYTTSEGTVGQTGIAITTYMASNGSMRMRYQANNKDSSWTNSVDHQYFSVQYGSLITKYRVDFYYSFYFGGATLRSSVTDLGWLVEGKTSNPTLSIYLWNWVSSGWDDTSKDLTSTEAEQSTSGVSITNYMSESRYMRIRFMVDNVGSSFTVSIDYMKWDVTYNQESTTIVWDLAPSSFHKNDTDQTFNFHVNYANGTTLPVSDYSISIYLGGGNDTANWSRSGTSNERILDPSTQTAGPHSFDVTSRKSGFTDGFDSKEFIVLIWIIGIIWISQPGSVYQPENITFRFQSNVTGISVEAYRDTTVPITFTWNGTMYIWSNSSAAWSVSLHWINATLSKTDFTSCIDSKTFNVLQHQLTILWGEEPTQVYQPNNITFSFQVRDENMNYFSNVTLYDYLDSNDGAITFTWNGTYYRVTLNSTTLSISSHQIIVNATLQYRTKDVDTKDFTVYEQPSGGPLFIEWAETPEGVFRPVSITFSFRVRDEDFNYYGDATIFDWLDGIDGDIAFTYNGTYYRTTLNSATLTIHTYTIDVNATKAFFDNATSYKNFWVNQHQLSIEWFEAPTQVYQPSEIDFSFKVKDELGNYFSSATIFDWLDGIDGNLTFTWNGTYYSDTLSSTSMVIKQYEISVYATKDYYNTTATNYKYFQVSKHQLVVEWISTPSIVIQPNNITFAFKVKDELNNYYVDTTILDLLNDNDTWILFTYNGTMYVSTINSKSEYLNLELHTNTIWIDSDKTWFTTGSGSAQFVVLTTSVPPPPPPPLPPGGGGGGQGRVEGETGFPLPIIFVAIGLVAASSLYFLFLRSPHEQKPVYSPEPEVVLRGPNWGKAETTKLGKPSWGSPTTLKASKPGWGISSASKATVSKSSWGTLQNPTKLGIPRWQALQAGVIKFNHPRNKRNHRK